MAKPVTRGALRKRLAEVSHATWIVQGVRDAERTLDGMTVPQPKRPKAPNDVATATQWLEAVIRDGRSLADFSDNEAHRVAAHDLERADQIIRLLEVLGIWEDPDGP